MFRALLIIVLLNYNLVYSQKLNKDVSLIVVKHNDTTKKDERDFRIQLKLTNSGTKPIVINNSLTPRVYMVYVCKNNSHTDTISTKELLERLEVDNVSQLLYQELKPNESKEITENLFGFIHKSGDYKIKLFYRLSDINNNTFDAESDWFNMYVLYTYDEVLKSE